MTQYFAVPVTGESTIFKMGQKYPVQYVKNIESPKPIYKKPTELTIKKAAKSTVLVIEAPVGLGYKSFAAIQCSGCTQLDGGRWNVYDDQGNEIDGDTITLTVPAGSDTSNAVTVVANLESMVRGMPQQQFFNIFEGDEYFN